MSQRVPSDNGTAEDKLEKSLASGESIEEHHPRIVRRRASTVLAMQTRNLTDAIAKADLKESARKSIQDLRDHEEVMPWSTIALAVVVAALSGLVAFLFHLSVRVAGCLGGLNGCGSSVLYDSVSEWAGPEIFFICTAVISGLICSLVLYKTTAGKDCIGGGGVGTKLAVASGQRVNPWVIPLRFFCASVYMGGGNTLGTEGPVIHLSITLATNIVLMMGLNRKKFISIFGVIGASAGMTAAFGVLISGFVYTIEELTRSLSRKLALILGLASAVAAFVKHLCEDLLHHYWHEEHVALIPHVEWDSLTKEELYILIALSVPIGIINGVAGYGFTRAAIKMKAFLSRPKDQQSWLQQKLLGNKMTHLAYAGLLQGVLGAIAYKVTGINGVWGTNSDAISNITHQAHESWPGCLLLFICKLAAFTIATAAGGPGGMLVPSLVAGGFIGLALGEMTGGGYVFCVASAVVGMGSLFGSVMYLPVTGIVIMYELTRADNIVLHIVLANFISVNVASRLPHGQHSFLHDALEKNDLWKKLGKQDFIETDEQEKVAKLGAQVAEKEMMELLRETSRKLARFEERGENVVRLVDTITLRTTIQPPWGGILIMVSTKKTMANGKVKVRNALPGTKQRAAEDAWAAAERILKEDLPKLHEHVWIRRDLPLEFSKDVKVSPSYKNVISEYHNTFVEANVCSSNPEVLSLFGIYADDGPEPISPKSPKTPGTPTTPGTPGLSSNPPKFVVATDDGGQVEYTWYHEIDCKTMKITFSGPQIHEDHSKANDNDKKESKSNDNDKREPKSPKKNDKFVSQSSAGNSSAYSAYSATSETLTPKTPMKEINSETKQCLRKALASVQVFSHVDEQFFDPLVTAMDEAKFKGAETVITQGKTDFLYVLCEGRARMRRLNWRINGSKSTPALPEAINSPVLPITPAAVPQEDSDEEENILQPGAVLGDQAMLHNAPWNISVIAVTDCVFWKLPREAFLKAVVDADVAKKPKIGLLALETIPLFQQLTSAERESFIQSLPMRRYSMGSYIIYQGDTNEDLFILLDGHCLCTQMDPDGGCTEPEEYSAGMCFGRSTFDGTSQRRSTSVVVKSQEALVLRASKAAFSKIMNPAMRTLLKGGVKRERRTKTFDAKEMLARCNGELPGDFGGKHIDVKLENIHV